MNLNQIREKMRKDPKFRKAEYEGQWDWKEITGSAIMLIRAKAGVTQDQLAKKAKKYQSTISRAEAGSGCSFSYLNDLAKSVDMKLEIYVVEADKSE